jgi:hypothetical protein
MADIDLILNPKAILADKKCQYTNAALLQASNLSLIS